MTLASWKMLVKGLYIFTDKNPKQTQNNPKTHQKNH